MPKFNDISKYTSTEGIYSVDVSWRYLLDFLKQMEDHKPPLAKEPYFQRGHVWTERQRIAYVEYKLAGGIGSEIIYLNCPGWAYKPCGDFVLVDGLQRLTSVEMFLKDQIEAYGYLYSKYEDHHFLTLFPRFTFKVNNLKTRHEVLKWYLEMNYAGTPHSEDELQRVEQLYKEAKENNQ